MTDDDYVQVEARIDRLAELGSVLRRPHTASLGDGLFELRFRLGPVAWRIPFWFAPDRVIVLLTVFRKQRMNERNEVARARQALKICTERHTKESDDDNLD